jgi:ribose transport system permease protein
MTPRIIGIIRRSPYLLSLLLFLVSLTLIGYFQPSYFRPSNLVNNLRSILPLVFVTIAQTIVVISGGIDLSLGSLLTLASVTTVQVFSLPNLAMIGWAAIPAGLGIAILAGALNGYAVAFLRLQPIVATFATSFLWSGIALWILPVAGGSVPDALSGMVRYKFVIPFGAAVLLFAILVWSLFNRLRICRYIYAVGGNPSSAHLSGIPVAAVKFTAYVLAGAISGIAAVLLAADIGTGDPLIGAPYTLFSVVALVIGGTKLSGGQGGIIGSVLGVLSLVLLRNLVFDLNIPYLWQPLVDGSIVLLALVGPGVSTLLRREKGTT